MGVFMDNNSCMGFIYEVKRGDTLYSISRQYNVPLDAIMRRNPFVDIYNLQIGTMLCIPSRVFFPFNNVIAYVVQAGESLQDILEKFDIDLDDLLEMNRLDSLNLRPGMELQIPVEDDFD